MSRPRPAMNRSSMASQSSICTLTTLGAQRYGQRATDGGWSRASACSRPRPGGRGTPRERSPERDTRRSSASSLTTSAKRPRRRASPTAQLRLRQRGVVGRSLEFDRRSSMQKVALCQDSAPSAFTFTQLLSLAVYPNGGVALFTRNQSYRRRHRHRLPRRRNRHRSPTTMRVSCGSN